MHMTIQSVLPFTPWRFVNIFVKNAGEKGQTFPLRQYRRIPPPKLFWSSTAVHRISEGSGVPVGHWPKAKAT